MAIPVSVNDPRMREAQCSTLKPITIVHENKWFSIKNRGGYYTLEDHVPQVTILPIVDNHSIVMVRVKRPVIADNPLELPAGAARLKEDPVIAARRELEEETGIGISQLNRFQLSPSLAISSNRHPFFPWIYQVDIKGREYEERDSHDHEIVSVECIPFEGVKNKIIRGEIYVSLSIAILSRFLFQKSEIDN